MGQAVYRKKETVITKQGNKIELIALEINNPKSKILFLGVTHGDEPQGYNLLNRYIERLKKEQPEICNSLYFVPCVNPDGMKLKQRTNSNGVDINRNFPTKNWEITDKNEFFGGEKPASENETAFLLDIIEKYKPDLIVSFHAPYKIVNYDGNAEKIAKVIAKILDYPAQSDIGYPTPGSFGTFFGIEKQIPTLTIELDETLSEIEQWNKCKNIFSYLEKDICEVLK